jgi:hypothetical protein
MGPYWTSPLRVAQERAAPLAARSSMSRRNFRRVAAASGGEVVPVLRRCARDAGGARGDARYAALDGRPSTAEAARGAAGSRGRARGLRRRPGVAAAHQGRVGVVTVPASLDL